MRLDLSDPNQAQMAFGTYQRDLIDVLRQLAKPSDDVLIAGANTGYVPLILAAMGCDALAFEADPRNIDICKVNFDLNPALPVKLFGHGLSNEEATIAMWQSDYGALSSFGAKHHASASVDVLVRRGDVALRDVGIVRLDGLLLDVEGWEVQVLEGLRDSLSDPPRWAIIECAAWALEAAGKTEQDLRTLINELGLLVVDEVHGGLVCQRR